MLIFHLQNRIFTLKNCFHFNQIYKIMAEKDALLLLELALLRLYQKMLMALGKN